MLPHRSVSAEFCQHLLLSLLYWILTIPLLAGRTTRGQRQNGHHHQHVGSKLVYLPAILKGLGEGKRCGTTFYYLSHSCSGGSDGKARRPSEAGSCTGGFNRSWSMPCRPGTSGASRAQSPKVGQVMVSLGSSAGGGVEARRSRI